MSTDNDTCKHTARPANKLRVAFETLGCRSNHADTLDLQLMLAERGGHTCDFDTAADVYVLNTCSVTDNADQEALRILRRLRQRAPEARIVVTGCLAEVGGDKIASANLADAIIGTGEREAVLNAVLGVKADFSATRQAAAAVPIHYANGRKIKKLSDSHKSIALNQPTPETLVGPGALVGEVRTRARFHLRVQEGCENSCTFCIIPQTRGLFSSRPLDALSADLKLIAAAGYKEVVLTGTHLGGWGLDLGLSFRDLLRFMLDESPVRRVRLSSIDPNDIGPEIIDLLGESHTFCNHLHICVQALSDSTLKRMNRRYRLAEVYGTMTQLKEKIPGICIGSDLITGFPGETREEVDSAVEQFSQLPFAYLHVFPYSERQDTAAAALSGVVPLAERRRRAARFRALSERRWREFASGLVGHEVEVVVEQPPKHAPTGAIFGTSREFAAVQIAPSPKRLEQTPLVGELLQVRVLEVDDQGVLQCE